MVKLIMVLKNWIMYYDVFGIMDLPNISDKHDKQLLSVTQQYNKEENRCIIRWKHWLLTCIVH